MPTTLYPVPVTLGPNTYDVSLDTDRSPPRLIGAGAVGSWEKAVTLSPGADQGAVLAAFSAGTLSFRQGEADLVIASLDGTDVFTAGGAAPSETAPPLSAVTDSLAAVGAFLGGVVAGGSEVQALIDDARAKHAATEAAWQAELAALEALKP